MEMGQVNWSNAGQTHNWGVALLQHHSVSPAKPATHSFSVDITACRNQDLDSIHAAAPCGLVQRCASPLRGQQ